MLKEKGWRVAIVWECALRQTQASITIDTVAKWLKTNEPWLDLGQLSTRKE